MHRRDSAIHFTYTPCAVGYLSRAAAFKGAFVLNIRDRAVLHFATILIVPMASGRPGARGVAKPRGDWVPSGYQTPKRARRRFTAAACSSGSQMAAS